MSGLAKWGKMEELEDGAQIVKVQHTVLHFVSGNVSFAKALDIRHRSSGTKLRLDHLMQEE